MHSEHQNTLALSGLDTLGTLSGLGLALPHSGQCLVPLTETPPVSYQRAQIQAKGAQLIPDKNPSIPFLHTSQVSPTLALSSWPPASFSSCVSPPSPLANIPAGKTAPDRGSSKAHFSRLASGETKIQRGQASPEQGWARPLLC